MGIHKIFQSAWRDCGSSCKKCAYLCNDTLLIKYQRKRSRNKPLSTDDMHLWTYYILGDCVCVCNPKKSAQPFRIHHIILARCLSVRLKAIALMRTCDDRVRCHTCVRTRVDPLYMICLYGSWEKRFRGAYVSWRHTQSTRPRRRWHEPPLRNVDCAKKTDYGRNGVVIEWTTSTILHVN